MEELAADAHPGRPGRDEVGLAPPGARSAGLSNLVGTNNGENRSMDGESGGGHETRGNQWTLKSKGWRLWRQEHDKMADNAIRAAKAHVALQGQKTKRFEKAADMFNQNPQATGSTINSKALSDRWSTVEKGFIAKNAADESATGTEPSWTAAEMVLIDVVPESQAHVDLEKASSDQAKKEERLVSQGEAICKMAMERRGRLIRGPASTPGGSTAGPNPSSGASSDDEVEIPAQTTRRRKRPFLDDEEDLWRSWSGERSGRPRRRSGKSNSQSGARTMSARCTRRRPHDEIALRKHSGRRGSTSGAPRSSFPYARVTLCLFWTSAS